MSPRVTAMLFKSSISPFATRFFRTLIVPAVLAFAVTARAQPNDDYTPRLKEPVFNVQAYGAQGDGRTNDTESIRAALVAAEEKGGGTVYLPAGTYRVAPDVEGDFAFSLRTSNLTIEGDGHDKTILSFLAWDMQDPADVIARRGGGFKVRAARGTELNNITLRGFRATGNAPPNEHAGKWQGEIAAQGWDTSHKGLAVWGEVDQLVVEDCEFDNWRGEVLYAGGGLELGHFIIRRNLVHHSNASAISMGGDILIEDSHIYGVHNGTEMLSMGGHQKLVVRNTLIEPNRGLEHRIGKFGLVYLGFEDSSLVVENSTIRDARQAAIFLSDFAHNVTIRNNDFVDNLGLYGNFMNLYPEFRSSRGFTNFQILDNRFIAETKDVHEAITFYSGGRDWNIAGNEVKGVGKHNFDYFLRITGDVEGTYVLRNNTIANAEPLHGTRSRRPDWIDNSVTGRTALGRIYYSFSPVDQPLVVEPTWPRLVVTDLKDGVEGKRLTVNPEILAKLPDGFELELRREGNNDNREGVEIAPDPTWNNLTRGYMLYKGAVLKLRLDENGRFSFVSFTPRSGEPLVITQSGPSDRDLHELSFRGFSEVHLRPSVAHAFNAFTGLAEGSEATIHFNRNVTISHVPGVIETNGNRDFIATGDGSVRVKKVDGALRFISMPKEALWASLATSNARPVSFQLPVQTVNGETLRYRIVQSPAGGTVNLSAIPVVTYMPSRQFIGRDRVVFSVSDGTEETLGAVELSVYPENPGADSDGDGLADLLEILFGSDPDDADSGFALEVSISEDGSVHLLVPPVAVAGLIGIVQSSVDLVNWQEEQRLTAHMINGTALHDLPVLLESVASGSGALFFRVLVVPETETS